jgi:hypothetical protein
LGHEAGIAPDICLLASLLSGVREERKEQASQRNLIEITMSRILNLARTLRRYSSAIDIFPIAFHTTQRERNDGKRRITSFKVVPRDGDAGPHRPG